MGTSGLLGKRRVREPASFKRLISIESRVKTEIQFTGFAQNEADLILTDLDDI
jgi:hypothetical protein